jgi:hypothetical protein
MSKVRGCLTNARVATTSGPVLCEKSVEVASRVKDATCIKESRNTKELTERIEADAGRKTQQQNVSNQSLECKV